MISFDGSSHRCHFTAITLWGSSWCGPRGKILRCASFFNGSLTDSANSPAHSHPYRGVCVYFLPFIFLFLPATTVWDASRIVFPVLCYLKNLLTHSAKRAGSPDRRRRRMGKCTGPPIANATCYLAPLVELRVCFGVCCFAPAVFLFSTEQNRSWKQSERWRGKGHDRERSRARTYLISSAVPDSLHACWPRAVLLYRRRRCSLLSFVKVF